MPPAPIWHIQLFGVLQVTVGEATINKFRTQATGLLLARLALRNGRPLPRGILIEDIWPELDDKRGRAQLNVATSALRKIAYDFPLMVSDPFLVSLDPKFFQTDVAAFEGVLKNARRAADPIDRRALLEQATDLYTDELLVGQHKEWVLPERQRLQALFDEAALELKRLQARPVRAVTVVPIGPEPQPSPVSPSISAEGLPPTFTRFFGRTADVAELVRRLTEPTDAGTLVTLIGTGGIGKTRLALEVAKQSRDAFEGRVYFAALADVASGSLEHIWDVIRDALPVDKEPSAAPSDQAASFLAQAPSLLILDNLEQLTSSGEAARVLNTLRGRVPSLVCLVTTRNVIGVEGEHLYTLGSLLTPRSGTDVEAQPAVQLFIDRARIVYHGFPATKANLSDILHLCYLLEGIPLAIELAAARASILTPAQLLSQVKSSFAILRTRRRDVPERQRSLFAAADSSYRLLSPDLQALFRRLSVFRGGWTLEAAEAVCASGPRPLHGVELFDALTELQECSLIVPLINPLIRSHAEGDAPSPEPRFRMLETLREFASDALREKNEANETRSRHTDFFALLAQTAEPHLAAGGTDQGRWLDTLETEQDNLLASLEQTINGLQMATHLHRFWFLRGYATEGKRRLASLLQAASNAPETERAKAHNALGILAWATGELHEAERQFAAALERYRVDNDARTIAGVLNNIGIVASQNGNFEVARASYTESIQFYKTLGDSLRESLVLTNLGGVLIYLHELEAAQSTLERGLAIQKSTGDRVTILRTLQNLAEVSMRQQNANKAATFLRESFVFRRALADRSTFWDALMTGAKIMIIWERYEEGATLWGAAQSMRSRAETASAPADANDENSTVDYLRKVMQPSEVDAAERLGRNMDFEQAFLFADSALTLGTRLDLDGSN